MRNKIHLIHEKQVYLTHFCSALFSKHDKYHVIYEFKQLFLLQIIRYENNRKTN